MNQKLKILILAISIFQLARSRSPYLPDSGKVEYKLSPLFTSDGQFGFQVNTMDVCYNRKTKTA